LIDLLEKLQRRVPPATSPMVQEALQKAYKRLQADNLPRIPSTSIRDDKSLLRSLEVEEALTDEVTVEAEREAASKLLHEE
jgi:hypothetical protein